MHASTILSLILMLCVTYWEEACGTCASCPSNECSQTGASEGKCYRPRYYRTSYQSSYYVTTYYTGSRLRSVSRSCGWWGRCVSYYTIYFQGSESSLVNRTFYHSNLACEAYCCTGYMQVHVGKCLRSCDTPRALTNGQRHFSNTTAGSMVTYTCNAGYGMTAGSSDRICQSSGLWSGNHPTCTNTFAIIGAPLTAASLVILVVAILICCLCKGCYKVRRNNVSTYMAMSAINVNEDAAEDNPRQPPIPQDAPDYDYPEMGQPYFAVSKALPMFANKPTVYNNAVADKPSHAPYQNHYEVPNNDPRVMSAAKGGRPSHEYASDDDMCNYDESQEEYCTMMNW